MKDSTEYMNQKLGPLATINALAEEIGDGVGTPEFKPYKDQTTLPYKVPNRDTSKDFDT